MTTNPRYAMKADNDCSVVALSKALELPYMTAYGMMIVVGRTNKRGPKAKDFIQFLDSKFECFPKPHMTVRNYVRLIANTGNWLIWVRGHIFAVVEGEIKDWRNNDNCHVEYVWRVK